DPGVAGRLKAPESNYRRPPLRRPPAPPSASSRSRLVPAVRSPTALVSTEDLGAATRLGESSCSDAPVRRLGKDGEGAAGSGEALSSRSGPQLRKVAPGTFTPAAMKVLLRGPPLGHDLEIHRPHARCVRARYSCDCISRRRDSVRWNSNLR